MGPSSRQPLPTPTMISRGLPVRPPNHIRNCMGTCLASQRIIHISRLSCSPLRCHTLICTPCPRHHSTPSHPASVAFSSSLSTQSPPAPSPRPTISSLIVSHAPPSTVPYLHLIRFDKPIGTALLLLPCTWSIGMATYAAAGSVTLGSAIGTSALFAVGALVMRGAGCTVNDMWDVKFDRMVERTRTRPLASGAITYPQAWAFLAAQLTVGLGVLLQLNWYSIVLGASSLTLVATYPLMKRVTYWPQAVLGLTFNWGALLGWSAVVGQVDWSVCLPLYFGGVCWTLVYDTIYALQDKKDDILAGVKSTALRFGTYSNTLRWLSFFGVSAISLFALAGIQNGQGWPYFAGVAAAGAHVAWQLRTLRWDNVGDALAKFKSNKWLGVVVLGGIVGDIGLQQWQGKRNKVPVDPHQSMSV
ncbi:Para-hydroxybenzoate--polyprenyltransferase, mitochondrial precursor (PHB:polyprenyltransferase) [Gonapodya sp. JEL0774]|nr:Para-hydroxybenzoate--polyprenyltransferase, mitochondrial precursor (PHB:polyprenyltransferase) [Gonapodya sp. JEL0774]